MAWSDAAREAALAARRAHSHPNTHAVMKSRKGTHTHDVTRSSYKKMSPAVQKFWRESASESVLHDYASGRVKTIKV